jgi:transposase
MGDEEGKRRRSPSRMRPELQPPCHDEAWSRPLQLIADKGYDSREFRRSLHQRGIRPCIPPKRRPANWKARQGRPVKDYTEEYRHRWLVERTFAWLGHQRRLLVRHEAKAENFHAFYALACIRIALVALLR